MKRLFHHRHRLVTAGAILLFLACAAPRAEASASVRPGLFALPAADFPQGSTVSRRAVEGNRQLVRDGVLFFGRHPDRFGRLTGFYMQADTGRGHGGARISTAYLVSIFETVRQAEDAFDLRYSSWFAAYYDTDPPTPPIVVGDGGQSAWFQMRPDATRLQSEWFFRCGSVLVEVFQNADGGLPTAEQAQSVLVLVRELNVRAHSYPAP